MPLEDSYLGRGWSFPPTFYCTPLVEGLVASADQGVAMVTGLTEIEQSLHILLTTQLGERILVPDFGCDLHALVFDATDSTMLARLQQELAQAVLYYEPRIDLLGVTTELPSEQQGTLLITLAFQIRSTNARHNYVYPFYYQEGTALGSLAPATPPTA